MVFLLVLGPNYGGDLESWENFLYFRYNFFRLCGKILKKIQNTIN